MTLNKTLFIYYYLLFISGAGTAYSSGAPEFSLGF
jgi:hypothetical protein